MSATKLAILCVTGLGVLGLASAAYTQAAEHGSTGSFVAVVAFVAAAASIISGFRYLTARRRGHLEITAGEQYRQLAEEYRRLSDLAVTAQEHTDLKMSEISTQLDFLRTQNEAVQKILRDVE